MIESFELAVIGAGPGGMEATISAAGHGVRTVLIDSYPQPGGQYFMRIPTDFKVDYENKTETAGRNLVNSVLKSPAPKILNCLVWGLFQEEDGSWLVGLYGEKAPKYIRAKNLILSTGSYDTPIAFPGWTLPGVVSSGGTLVLLKNQRVAPGKRAVISGTGPLLFSVAAHLIKAGVEVVAVCEANHILPRGIKHAFTMLRQWDRLTEGAKYMSTILRGKAPYKIGWSIVEARGQAAVEQAVIAKVDKSGQPIAGTEQVLDVDLVVSGFTLTPNTGLLRMLDCEMTYQPGKGGWIPLRDQDFQTSIPGVFAIGDGAGIGGAENARLEGKIAGTVVAKNTGHLSLSREKQIRNALQAGLQQQQRFGGLLSDLFSPPEGLVSLLKDDTIICRCEEISLAEVKEAIRNGARSIGEVKMLTRTGMGNCQGRMCEHSVTAIIAHELADEGITREEIGYYSIRPPLHPLPQSFLADAVPEEEEKLYE
ncbi:MAG: NAD(P)/FAD-dependent oxidoreductase [Anaerolineaceae bacterium]|jgi:NADPH-dependent 2,4-dienoyl-CoA reductase/sulfur reductase-like enzyme|nr:NAD(P)/FAD-dependent oxidoreductase [Anaerolineaceae bacterium]